MTKLSHRRTPAVSALVLAGGASSRFGGPKPLAVLRGRTLVEWVASALAPLSDELIVSIGVRADEEPFRRAVPHAHLVRDRRGDRGPIEGLRQGFRAARGDIVLVAPSDAPLLRTDLYRTLLSLLGGHQAAVPRSRVFDPVRAVYRRSDVLRVLGPAGDRIRSPSALVDRLDAVFLEDGPLLLADPDLASFIDVNRREDLERASRARTVPS